MPGFAEYLDVENGVKVMGNLLPADASDTGKDTWEQIKELAEKLDASAGALVTATKGRSQEPTAKELKDITDQLARAVGRVADGSADEGGVATTRSAINALPGILSKFDEDKLKRS